jgi:hypothetical protein
MWSFSANCHLKSVEAMDVCFIVRDANRHALAYVYFEEEPRLCKYIMPEAWRQQ